ncbi:hypothetical protein F5Y15DRAFT_378770 [Xylariaceae sp. FL0016]|nr:hypothetical protein F5Y15DRAFT_378770 [Xylariaceae sp. FL0016]
MALANSSVTIDRAYFDTLVRRANHNNDVFSSASDASVALSRDEYESLLLTARQFSNLKHNLIGAGVTEENITALIQDGDSLTPQAHTSDNPTSQYEETEDGGARLASATQSYAKFRFRARPAYNTHFGHGQREYDGGGANRRYTDKQHDWADDDFPVDNLSPPYSAEEPTSELSSQRPLNHAQNMGRPQFARVCKRTIALCGLFDTTTHLDVTSAVRGGILVDIFLRPADHMALVSFLREEDAVRYYDHARKNDLYIQNKRVFIRWGDRHFHLAGHVANKVAIGATRNLILRRCDPSLTEDALRDDLDHIHNLAVIKVDFVGSSCYIKTNSIHNAMFARTCMISRAKYRGSKIEWDVDECAQPIETVQKAPLKPPTPRAIPTKSKPVVGLNRFDMLRIDDDDNDESDDKFDTSTEMPGTVGVTA